MSNIEIYLKTVRVVESCKSRAQLDVAKKYVDNAIKVLDIEWVSDIIKIYDERDREFRFDLLREDIHR